jgi:hypothetical protein
MRDSIPESTGNSINSIPMNQYPNEEMSSWIKWGISWRSTDGQ